MYQGVHQLFDGAPDRKWLPGEKRVCKLVFIGRYLNADDFTEAFRSCLVSRDAEAKAPVAA